jgi:hypothetical protein
MLPNWCKKLGFFLFIFGFSTSFYSGFMEGVNGGQFNSSKYNEFDDLFSESIMHLFEIIAIIGMVIYMFSKEKIEDDYIYKLRLESFQLTSLIGLGITIISYAISEEIKLTLDYFIILFLWIYLVTFALKKRIY